MTLTFHEVINIKKSKIDYNAINEIANNNKQSKFRELLIYNAII